MSSRAAAVASLNKYDCSADATWVNGFFKDRAASKLLAAGLLTIALTACGGGGGTAPGSVFAAGGAIQNQSALGSSMSASSGTIASGYIECDTAANTAAGNNCNNFANFFPASGAGTGGAFVFTAIAATSSGTPIVQQLIGASAATFPNGSYQVVESAGDNPPILSIAGGPWAAPGSALGGSDGSYGNHVSVTCMHRGTGNLELQLVSGSGTQALPLSTRAYAANTTTVMCSSSGAITIN